MLRLVLALVLVIVAMRQASRPEIYRPFFGPSDRPQIAEPEPSAHPQSLGGSSAPADALPAWHGDGGDPGTARSATNLSEDRLRSVVLSLDPANRQRLTELLAWRRHSLTAGLSVHRDVTDRKPVLPSEAEQLAVAVRSAAGDQADAVPLADAVRQAAAGGDLSPPTVSILASLQAALDRWYQTQVVDGGTWSRSDADAFYRYLERAASHAGDQADRSTEFSLGAATRIGVAPLLQQPEPYLGRMVAIGGTVARAQQRPAAENPFGVSSYWEVWLRPDDGTEHPVMLYSPHVPTSVAAVGPNATLQRGPAVIAVGRFLKRRLFASAAGAEQAPVLVGRLMTPQHETEVDGRGGPLSNNRVQPSAAATHGAGTAASPSEQHAAMWPVVVGIAAALGIATAGILMWRTSVAARRSRRVRQRALAATAHDLDQLQVPSRPVAAEPIQERAE